MNCGGSSRDFRMERQIATIFSVDANQPKIKSQWNTAKELPLQTDRKLLVGFSEEQQK